MKQLICILAVCAAISATASAREYFDLEPVIANDVSRSINIDAAA